MKLVEKRKRNWSEKRKNWLKKKRKNWFKKAVVIGTFEKRK